MATAKIWYTFSMCLVSLRFLIAIFTSTNVACFRSFDSGFDLSYNFLGNLFPFPPLELPEDLFKVVQSTVASDGLNLVIVEIGHDVFGLVEPHSPHSLLIGFPHVGHNIVVYTLR